MGPSGRNHFNAICTESTHRIHSLQPCILLERVSTNVVQRIVKFQVLVFLPIFLVVVYDFFFFFVFVNMGPSGRKHFKRNLHCQASTHRIHSLKIMHTSREGRYQFESWSKNCEISNFDFFGGGWGFVNMGPYGGKI